MRWNAIKRAFIGTLRVQLYLFCVGSLVAYVSFVRARDRAEHMLGELGIGMLSSLGKLEAGVEEVELNGQRFTFGAATSEDLPENLVAEFEQHCHTASGTLEQDLAPLVAEAKRRGTELPGDLPIKSFTALTDASEDLSAAHGACFVRPTDFAPGSMLERIRRFTETGKLGTLGGFRYLRADRKEDSDYTRVLAIASSGDFDMDAIFPDSGDAAGSDPTVAARPPKSVRTFSARITDTGQGAYLYESDAPREELLKHYETTLAKKQLARVELPDEQEASLKDARVYAAQNGAVVLSVTDEGEKRTVSIYEFGQFDAAMRQGS